MIELLHSDRLSWVRYPETFDFAEASAIVQQALDGKFPADYDTLIDFRATRAFTITSEEIVDLAIRRRRTLPMRTKKLVKSAILAADEALTPVLAIWRAFFDEPDPALLLRAGMA